jgi:putative DNA primase/helicase
MTVLEIARSYVRAGLSVLPARCDGSKRPALATWKAYQSRIASPAELLQWFGREQHGVIIICGKVSGNLEVLDFDRAEEWVAWAELVESRMPGVLARLPQVLTPSGGRHLYYRTPLVSGNTKLARAMDGKETLIETRGEGGYVLAPGCPPSCHPSGGTYRRVAGPSLLAIPQLAEVLS